MPKWLENLRSGATPGESARGTESPFGNAKCKFAVTVVSPPGYIHAAAFREVAESIHYGLRALDYDSILTTEGSLPGRRHIVLGSNLLLLHPLPIRPEAILYNLEQVDVRSSWLRPETVDVLRRHVVWDYSARNAATFRQMGIAVAKVVPIGYVPELARITFVPEPEFDVLFVGSMNPRRQRIVDQMSAMGLRVHCAFGIYGAERDLLIARAKLMLNMHYHEAKVLEIVRISYLLANRCAVLSERSADKLEDATLADGVAFADYHDLARRAGELINAPAERTRLSNRGFEVMSARMAKDFLRDALSDICLTG